MSASSKLSTEKLTFTATDTSTGDLVFGTSGFSLNKPIAFSGGIKSNSVIVENGSIEVANQSELKMSGVTGTLLIKPADDTTDHTITFPNNQGSLNSYLKNDGNGNLSWTTLTTSSSNYIDFSGLIGSANKINTTSDTSQTLVGDIYTYTLLSGNCSVGQPLITQFTSGVIGVSPITSTPNLNELAGISEKNTTVSNSINVLRNGFCTARISNDYPSTSLSLDNTTNNTTNTINGDIVFTDSGGTGFNYSNSEDYNIIFAAQSGKTIDIDVTSFSFEHTTSRMYDRLGIQVSNDNVTYNNITGVSWLQSSSTSTPSWSSTFYGTSWNSTGSNNGYIFPKDIIRAILLGASSFPTTIQTGYRYVKFYFKSDSSTTDVGWNLTIKSNPVVYNVSLSVNTPLYVDSNDFTKVTSDNTSNLLIGYSAYEDISNGSVFMKVAL